MCSATTDPPEHPVDGLVDGLIGDLVRGLVSGLARCRERGTAAGHGAPPSRLAVALSGGGDSAVLLGLLCRLDAEAWREAGWQDVPQVQAVHCNHGMTSASPALESAARATATACGVPLAVLPLDITVQRGESPEAIARLHRYRALAEWLPAGVWLLTAHHADDQAETLLLQALRGAGLEGLAAMPWSARLGQGLHVRPLLATSRRKLLAARAAVGLQAAHFVAEDPMNTDPRLDRAYLREALWPVVEARWPGANLTLARAAGHLQDALQVVDAVVERELLPLLAPLEGPAAFFLAPSTLDLAGLATLPLARRAQVLRAWIRREGHRSPPAARVGTLVEQMLAARGDATPGVRWGDSEIHAWRGRYYLGRRSGPSLAARLAAAAAPPPPWRQELPRMSGLPVEPGGTGTDLGAAGRLRLEWATSGPRLRPAPGMAWVVRGRVGGERLRLRHGTAGVHQDVRKLLQAAAVPPWLRDEVPFLWLVPSTGLPDACRVFGSGELVAVGASFHDASRLAEGGEPGWRVVWAAPFA